MSERRLTWDEYAAQWSTLHGGVDPRRSAPSVYRWLRLSYRLGRMLAALRCPPNLVTLVGLGFCAAVPILAVYRGYWLFVAAGAVLLAALADSADGAVAVITGRHTRLGAFYDSLADRLGEAFWLFALWLLGAPGLLVTACGAVSWLHEYVRARAMAGGVSEVGVITVAERPSRVICVIMALVLGGVVWYIEPPLTPGLITIVLGVWAVLGLIGVTRLTAAIRTAISTPR